jgi:hypothetical protein
VKTKQAFTGKPGKLLDILERFLRLEHSYPWLGYAILQSFLEVVIKHKEVQLCRE